MAVVHADAIPDRPVRHRLHGEAVLRAALVSLFAVFLVLFVLYPMTQVLARSFQSNDGRWIGLANYTRYFSTPAIAASITNSLAVSGTTIGPEPRLFLAGAFGFGIDIELAPNLVFLRYTDMPGVIGRVGTMFGEAGVNIANMAVSRTHEAGKALMAFAIDAPAPPEVVERIHAEGFDDAQFVSLG